MLRLFTVVTMTTMVSIGSVTGLVAQDYRVEPITEAPAVDAELPASFAGQFAEQGFKILRGSNRTVLEFWPCKTWQDDTEFTPSLTRLYPFSPGQLIGVLHLPRRGSDFRGQQIQRGWYTVRFALQPVDGNHVGTSPTQDFLVMIRTQDETSPEPLAAEDLISKSAAAAGASHPAMLCLQPQGDEAPEEATLQHNEERDWWTLSFSGTPASHPDKKLAFRVVVVGQAEE